MISLYSQVENSGALVLGKFTKSNSVKQKNERFHEFILQDQSSKLLPKERVCNCCKKRITKQMPRSVMYNVERGKTYWGNVQRCGSIWTCPVCSKQISEKRKSELKQAVAFWKSKGKGLLLLTLTSPHTQFDRLSDILAKQRKALKNFFGDRKGRDLFKMLGREHQIKSFEITYGVNGWHPHYHILLFINREIDFSSSASVDDLEISSFIYDEFLNHWKNCCKKNGLDVPNEHGLDIRDGSYAEEYISKFGENETKIIWGIESEMTKGVVKRGRFNSLHPFDLLQLSIDDDLIFNDKKPSKLFQEYAVSLKGARQLVWSRGFKKLIGIDEVTDDEIVNETEQKSVKVLEVEDLIFDVLTKTKSRHLFLDWVKKDYENQSFIEDLRYSDGITARNLIKLFEQYIEMQSDDCIQLKDKCSIKHNLLAFYS